MGRYKNLPLKKSLLKQYLPVPKWLTMAMGLDMAVFLCEVVDTAGRISRGQHTDAFEMDIYSKRILKEYGISYHRQQIIMQTLRECKIFLFRKRNKYRNRKVLFKMSYCWVVFEILQLLKNDMRKPFFDKLITSSKLRNLLRKIESSMGDDLSIDWDRILDKFNKELKMIFKNDEVIPAIAPLENVSLYEDEEWEDDIPV